MKHNNFPEKKMQFREEKHFVSIESIERKLNIIRTSTQTESKISVSGHAFPSLYKIHFQNTYRNITSIELVSANIGLTCDGNLSNPNELVQEPYVLLILDEIDGIFDSANVNISNAFAKIPTASSGTFIRNAGGGSNYRKVYYPNPLASLNALTIRLVKNNGELVDFGPEYFNTPCSCRYYTPEEMTSMNLEIGSTYLFSDKETPSNTHVGTITQINIPKLCKEGSNKATVTIENRKSIKNTDLDNFNKNYNIICEIYSTLKGYKKYLPEIYNSTIRDKIIAAKLEEIGDGDNKFDFKEEYITTYEKFNNWLNKEKYKIKQWCKTKAEFYDELYNKKNNECNKKEKNLIVVENEARCKAISIVESIICNLENYVTYLKDPILNGDDLDTIGFDLNDINSANDITGIINSLYSKYLSKCNKKTTLEIPDGNNPNIKWDEHSKTKTFDINSATGIDFEKEIIEVNSKDDIKKKCSVDKINFNCPLVRSFNNYRPKEVGKSIKQRNLTFKTETSVEDCCTDEEWKKYAYVEGCSGEIINNNVITIKKSDCCTKNYKVGNYLQLINNANTIHHAKITLVECEGDDIQITVDSTTFTGNITICHQANVNVLNKCKNCCNLEECCFNKWIQNSFTFCITTREQVSAFQSHNLHY